MAEKKRISVLEIFNLETKVRTVVREFTEHIEAPNWIPGSEELLYNSGGLLYRFHIKSKQSERIETGICTRCNNDHVISPDGKWIAISAGTEEEHASRIWVVPMEGGEPRLITKDAPSYLHGISPDGRTLAYCAQRNGEYDIYTIPTEGGEETRLTDAPGLNDGPEYSPDGKHIWFNSVRTGLMQAFRMKADGTEQTQMTFSEDRNNWFPHVSPDGEKVVFVSYNAEEVEPGDHPANQNIEVRMMSSGGGEPVTLLKGFGGQGTMNVNSWAPDSNRFAYVTYRFE